MQVAKWGNSLAVRLPSRLVKQMNLKVGDEVDIARDWTSAPADQTKAEAIRLLIGLRKHRGSLPADVKFDRDEANAR